MDTWLLPSIVSSLCSFAGAWAAMRVEMRWLRRDVDLAHQRIDALQQRVFNGAQR